MPYPHDPGTLEAPMTATESGANKYCQWLCLIRRVSGKLFKFSHLSGAEGIRTPYLLNANQAFSQLNYGPVISGIIATRKPSRNLLNIADVIK